MRMPQLECDIGWSSFVAAPIRDRAFFEQAVVQRQVVGQAFRQYADFAAQVLHLTGGRGTGSVAGRRRLPAFVSSFDQV